MVRWQDISINARIALCLIYAEKMIPKIKAMIACCDEAKKYSQGEQQINDILDLGWSHLLDKSRVDWSEMYALCNEGHGWTDDERYGGCGYFDFIIELNCCKDEDSIVLSNMMIFCFYYAIYHFAKRQNEVYIPEDLEWFEMEESEAETFAWIDKAVNRFIPIEERQTVSKFTEDLYKLFPFNKADPYGEYLDKEKVHRIVDRK